MAAAQILVGLTTLTDAEATTGFERVGDTSGGGASNPAIENEVFIQGGNSVVRRVTGAGNIGGLQYDIGAGNELDFTSSPDHVFIWLYNLSNQTIETIDNGGIRIFLSDGADTNYYDYYVDGKDLNPYGGWKCFPVSPNQAGALIGGSGITTASVRGFGGQFHVTATLARISNFAIDAIRVGTGLTVYNGEPAAPAGITSLTDINDALLNQYGVCQKTPSGASIQGKIGIGLDDNSTETYYEDSNVVFVVPNKNPLSVGGTFNTLSDFTGISIEGGITTAKFTNTSFNSVDKYDKGYFSCSDGANEPANVELDGCTFQNWGPTTLSGNTSATNTTWIGCEPVTLNSGTLDNCTIEAGIGGTYVVAGSTPNNISNTSFIGVNTTDTSATGYGHALEITSSGSYDFVNNSFVGFDTTGSDGAAIHIDGSGLNVTLNISGNDATASPTYKLSNGANTPVFNAAVTVNVTGLPVVPAPQDATEIRVLLAGQNLFATSVGIGTTDVNAGVGTETHRTGTFSFNITKDIDIDLRIINLDYEPQFISSIRTANDPTNISANLKEDRVSQNLKQ